MYSKVILIGRLTKDPELRYTPKGTPVASFSLALNYRYKQSDEMKEETTFIDIVVFGKLAEFSGKYLNKGTAVIVDGRLQQRRWESDGQQRSKIEVVAQSVNFLPGSKRAAEDESSPSGEGDFTPPAEKTDLEPF
ncbi:MAG: single-stranded DNA-binding protein [Nitrospira bacterium HGW-Nitrospira-1]|nr:MAG: single-stranded DNA-binding protein [Nitrospira bacterium HGW-Nitrospira-1]